MKAQSYRDIETDHAWTLHELRNERIGAQALLAIQRVMERGLSLARERVESGDGGEWDDRQGRY